MPGLFKTATSGVHLASLLGAVAVPAQCVEELAKSTCPVVIVTGEIELTEQAVQRWLGVTIGRARA